MDILDPHSGRLRSMPTQHKKHIDSPLWRQAVGRVNVPSFRNISRSATKIGPLLARCRSSHSQNPRPDATHISNSCNCSTLNLPVLTCRIPPVRIDKCRAIPRDLFDIVIPVTRGGVEDLGEALSPKLRRVSDTLDVPTTSQILCK